MFNHEGERRGATFVTRKITRAVANYFYGNKEILYLGNLNARRDWGYANDYVKTMWLMLQQKKPSDYVISTGVSKSVKDFVNEAYNCIGVKIIWKGKGLGEVGIDQKTKKILGGALSQIHIFMKNVSKIYGRERYSKIRKFYLNFIKKDFIKVIKYLKQV